MSVQSTPERPRPVTPEETAPARTSSAREAPSERLIRRIQDLHSARRTGPAARAGRSVREPGTRKPA